MGQPVKELVDDAKRKPSISPTPPPRKKYKSNRKGKKEY